MYMKKCAQWVFIGMSTFKNNNQINWRKMDPNALFELLYQKTK